MEENFVAEEIPAEVEEEIPAGVAEEIPAEVVEDKHQMAVEEILVAGDTWAEADTYLAYLDWEGMHQAEENLVGAGSPAVADSLAAVDKGIDLLDSGTNTEKHFIFINFYDLHS